VEWEKCGVLDKSDNISETRKDRGKVSLWSTYMNTPVTDALSDGTILDPLWPPLPKNWGSQPRPKNAIAIISGADFKIGQNIHRVHPNKSPL